MAAPAALVESSRARYAPQDCWFGVPVRGAVECAMLVVPENWGDADSAAIHLPVVVFHARERRSQREPIILLSGGPGGRPGIRSGAQVGQWLAVLESAAWAHEREVIMLAQRGTNWTDSDLSCPSLEVGQDGRLDRGSAAARLADCGRRLAGRYDLAAYNSSQNAQDVLALAGSMGLERWSLYGVSYGSRFALAVMGREPAGLQSVILDSVVPPTVNHLMPRSPVALAAPLAKAFAACRRDALCREHFPDPEGLYEAAVTRLEGRPISLRLDDQTVAVDPAVLRAVLSELLAASQAGAIPGLLESVTADQATDLWQAFYRGGAQGGGYDLAVGALMTIACNDGVDVRHAIAERNGRADLAPDELDLPDGAPCRDWPTFPADAAGRAPVRSAVPTLILTGELDPLTPPENARIAAATLPRAQVFVLPMAGHGVLWTQPCAAQIVQAFLDRPERRPAVTCPPPAFDASISLKVRTAHLVLRHELTAAGEVLEALLAAQEAQDPASDEVATTLALLGELYHEQRRLAPAASALAKALAIRGKTHGLNSVEAGEAAGRLADVYYDQARWSEALTMYRRALRALARAPDHSTIGRYQRRERQLTKRLSG